MEDAFPPAASKSVRYRVDHVLTCGFNTPGLACRTVEGRADRIRRTHPCCQTIIPVDQQRDVRLEQGNSRALNACAMLQDASGNE